MFKRAFVLMALFAVSFVVFAALPAAAELPECDYMPINYTHAHDFQGWGHYLVSLGWGEHSGAYQYKVTLTPPGVTFGPTPVGWNWLAVPADWFREWGVLEVVIVALGADGNELCYTRSKVGPLDLTVWNPPEAPKPPLPTWLWCCHVPVSVSPAAAAGPSCGDGVCNGAETTATCPADCGPSCGDGVCGPAETFGTYCAADCCGNGSCDPEEMISTYCAADCCGNGACETVEDSPGTYCVADCCGNGACEPAEDDNPDYCAADCCGNGACETAENADPNYCAADCCGNGICETAEMTSTYCAADCCGNGTCELGEDTICPADCP